MEPWQEETGGEVKLRLLTAPYSYDSVVAEPTGHRRHLCNIDEQVCDCLKHTTELGRAYVNLRRQHD